MATYYISPTGNDTTGDGTIGTPWATISKAHTSASNGDTIICLAGTYTMANQTFTKALTIQGATTDPSLYVFDANSASVLWKWNSVSCNIQYLKFIRWTTTGKVDGRFWIAHANDTASYITNCMFVGQLGSDTYTGAVVSSTNGNASSSLTVSNSLFNVEFLSASNSPVIYTGSASTAVVTMTNCVIHVTGSGTPNTQSWGVINLHSGYLYFYLKNVIADNVGASKSLFSTAYFAQPPPAANMTYSCLYNFTTNPTVGTGSITSDPLFVDSASGNFNLRPTSPCLDTGVVP